MRRWLFCGVCCLFAYSLPASAQQQDARYWLDRIVTSAHKLNYSGTFVFENAELSETSRITHLVESGGEQERIEVLDGSPREVLRSNDEIKCYLPESHTLIIEKRGQQRSFPALLPAAMGGLSENYVIRKGALGRVAERESQSVLLEPKDGLRYGYQFWVDVNTGLLLKARLVNERGERVETFTFTQLQIGGAIEHDALRSKYETQSKDWLVRDVRATQSRGEEAAWQFNVQLPGFAKIADMKRRPRPGAPDSTHLVFSDGLAAISVFIEPLGGHVDKDIGMIAVGATNVYSRVAGDHLLVVMGEVPQATLKKFGDGIEAKRK